MQLTVSGHHMEVTEPLKEYTREKIMRIQKHFDHVTNTNVVLQVDKDRHLAEATVHAKGATLHANAEGTDMYAAIDSLTNKLDRQVIKHKEKSTDHHRSDGGIKKHNSD